jgi:EAL domain-containing protein (putative c-di-GMP-specific phosphodiesterase class I)/GGDEF domain-containing protein
VKVFNSYYENKESLNRFISTNKINKYENILVQIFCGVIDKDYILKLIKQIQDHLPHAKIIGSTTDGEICQNRVSTHKTVLSFTVFQDTKIETIHSFGKDSKELANNLLKQIDMNDDLKLLITFTDGISTNGEKYIKTIQKKNKNLVVAGGLAGDNANFKQTFVFTEEGCFTGLSAVGALFYNPNLVVNSEYNFGWEPIGKELLVTSAKENIVYTIDNQPARKVYEKYLGKSSNTTYIEFPLIIKRDGTNVARAILSKNDDDSLTFAGDVNEGESVQFGYGNINDILNSNNKIRYRKLDNKPTEAYFIYSCMARRRLIGETIADEIAPLSNVAPSAGFFTYGELYYNQENLSGEFLNQTMTIISLSEDINSIKKLEDNLPEKASNQQYNTLKALSKLISTSSDELKELTNNLKQSVDEKTKELARNYYHSQITNLKNENALLEDLKNKSFYGLIVFEIDKFGDYNEIYGLSSGNMIIKNFAEYLYNTLDNHIYEIYHVHSNQFMVRLKRDDHDFDHIAKNLLFITQNFECTLESVNESIKVDITLGMVKEKPYSIQKALIALGNAKKYKKEYSIYTIEMDQSSISKDILFWKKEIRKAIKEDNIIPVFQPIVNSDGEIEKYEILMRLRREKDGEEELVSPFFFLDIAIKTKLYPKLTAIMVEKSFPVIKESPVKFSFNLSFEDIENEEMISLIKDRILKYDIGDKLILEIVESVDIENYQIIKDFIHDIKGLGVEIAIDDFGSGFSNYLHVLEIKPDYIKIDGSLIKTIDKSEIHNKFVKSIVSLSKSLEIKTIAEFVHSKEVFEVCEKSGVDQFQGYLFSPPVKLEVMKNFEKSSLVESLV